MSKFEILIIFIMILSVSVTTGIFVINRKIEDIRLTIYYKHNEILSYLNPMEKLLKGENKMKKKEDYEMVNIILDNFLKENQEPKKITIKIEILDKNIDSKIENERIIEFKKTDL